MLMIFTVMLCYLSSRPEWDLNPDLWDAGAMVYQLCYEANW